MKSSWQTKNIEDVIEKVTYSTKIPRSQFLAAGTFPVISQETAFINGYWNIEKDVFKLVSPVIIFGDHTQVLKYIDFDFVLGADGVKILQPKYIIDPRYFYYFLLSLNQKKLGYARHYRLLKEFDIHYPDSLVEQKRIVKILDGAFEKIAKAKENTEKNLQNSQELFESYLQNIFDNPKADWKQTTLGNEVDLLSGFAFKSTGFTEKFEDIKLLRGDNILPRSIRWESVKRWPRNQVQGYSKYELNKGDVVLAMDRPWIKSGLKHTIINASDLPCLLVQRVARLRVKETLNEKYLLNIIGSLSFTKHILDVQSGIGVPHISGGLIKDYIFTMPHKSDQERIIKKLDLLSSQTKKLEANYKQKIADLEELKKSLLTRAFAGEL